MPHELRGNQSPHGFRVLINPPAGWGPASPPLRLGTAARPESWIVATGFQDNTPELAVEQVVLALRKSAEALAAKIDTATTKHDGIQGRARPLVALPVVGTGTGGLRHLWREVVALLVPRLVEEVAQFPVDAVIVCRSAEHHLAVQHARRGTWPPMGEHEARVLIELTHHAATNRLVPFLGAGTGIPVGLPLWRTLLTRMARRAGRDPAQFDALSPLDAAQILRPVLGTGYHAFLRETFTVQQHALAHGLLASLDAPRAFTTNYDQAFELAAAGANPHSDQGVVVLCPLRHGTGQGPRLVKLHGDVDQIEGIVLTRDEYLQLKPERLVLESLLQGSLVTDHVLFVGYSLVDDDFVRLVKEARRALDQTRPADPYVGTVLALRRGDLFQELWEGDVHWLGAAAPGTSDQDAARELETLLDRLVHHVVTGTTA